VIRVSSRGPFPYLTLEELDEVIHALEIQAGALALMLKRSRDEQRSTLSNRYQINLSLLTAALEFRADEFRDTPARARFEAAWAGVEFGSIKVVDDPDSATHELDHESMTPGEQCSICGWRNDEA
jgi:hypothetical protein